MSSRVFWSESADRDKPHCVYLVSYSGKDIPPFYVGKGMVKNFIDGGKYHGSPSSKEYKRAWHESFSSRPHLFKRFIIQTFETGKEAREAERRIQKKLDVKNNPLHLNERNSGWPGNEGPMSEAHKASKRGPRGPLKKPRKRISEADRAKLRGPRGPQKNPRRPREVYHTSSST